MNYKWLMYARINTIIYSVAGVLMLLVIWLTGEFRENLYSNVIDLVLFFGIASLNVFASIVIIYRTKRKQSEGLLAKLVISFSFIGVLIGNIYYACPTYLIAKNNFNRK
ncbi:MAG: hypothetical protein AB7U79_03645 [Candidatus Izemoplasmatales bacterium]